MAGVEQRAMVSREPVLGCSVCISLSLPLPAIQGKKRSVPRTVAEKLAEATACRERGKALFQGGEYSKAASQYSRVFAYTRGLDVASEFASYQNALGIKPPTEEQLTEIHNLEVACLSNLAICNFKNKKYSKAIDYCKKVLEQDPEHGKALCTQGRAFAHMGDIEKAEESLVAAAKLCPNDVVIQKELARIPALKKKQAQKEKNTWKAAFNKLS